VYRLFDSRTAFAEAVGRQSRGLATALWEKNQEFVAAVNVLGSPKFEKTELYRWYQVYQDSLRGIGRTVNRQRERFLRNKSLEQRIADYEDVLVRLTRLLGRLPDRPEGFQRLDEFLSEFRRVFAHRIREFRQTGQLSEEALNEMRQWLVQTTPSVLGAGRRFVFGRILGSRVLDEKQITDEFITRLFDLSLSMHRYRNQLLRVLDWTPYWSSRQLPPAVIQHQTMVWHLRRLGLTPESLRSLVQLNTNLKALAEDIAKAGGNAEEFLHEFRKAVLRIITNAPLGEQEMSSLRQMLQAYAQKNNLDITVVNGFLDEVKRLHMGQKILLEAEIPSQVITRETIRRMKQLGSDIESYRMALQNRFSRILRSDCL